ncbi:hypothetical protein HD806DRAFT_64658 [Xylariaceae sp. AK1471]|nr:hypothetical protein HD806DRAFT_64658 [Xylariaceae sp. AK1471]
MPEIDGQKVACWPCIRGHRSTGCKHYPERIMFVVNKPGRPLSTCPHPKDKACGCDKITLAIPRTAKCGCGTPDPKAKGKRGPKKSEPSTAETFTSPTKTGFRVQKSTFPRPPSRTQSYDPSDLSRMTPNPMSLMALSIDNHFDQGSPIPPSGFAPNLQPSFNSGGPLGQAGQIPSPGFVPPMNSMSYGSPVPAHDTNMPIQFHSPVVVDNPVDYRPPTQHIGPSTTVQYYFPYGNRLDEPLQFRQWKQFTATPSQMVAPQGAYPNPQSVIETTETSATESGSYMITQCVCGPGCQCVGCTVHPFNSTTQAYAYSVLTGQHSSLPNDNSNGRPHGQHSRASSLSNGNSNGTPHTSNGVVPGDLPSPAADTSSPEDTSPSGTGSADTMQPGASEIPSSEVLFVEYPFAVDGLCSGDSNSCPCGDDCACVDCMIHGTANAHLQPPDHYPFTP